MQINQDYGQIWENILYREKRSWFLAGLFGFLFSLSYVFGQRLECYGSLPLADQSMWGQFFIIGFLAMFFCVVAWTLLSALEGQRVDRPVPKHSWYEKWDSLPVHTRNFILWAVLVLLYLIVLLAVYPGFFVYDAQDELTMVETRSFTTHHPLMHVLLLGGVISGVHHFTDSYNLGIFIYSLLQMMAIAGAFVYVLDTLRRRKIARAVRVAGYLFLGFSPTVVMFVLCTAKDGIFSAALLILVTEAISLFCNPDKFFQSRHHAAIYLLSATIMMLFRHNGFYAYLVFIPFLVGFSRKHLKRALFLGIFPVLLTLVLSTGMQMALHATSDENQEMLTVPIQQLARTYIYDKDSFTPEEDAIMESLMTTQDWTSYTPKLSDPVKVHFNNKAYEENKSAFWSLWLSKGISHPAYYLNAWMLTSYGFWYPKAVLNCYEGNTVFTFTYKNSSYFGFETELPGERRSFIPLLEELYRQFSLEAWPQELPVIHWLFSPACYFWAMLFTMFFAIDARRWAVVRAFIPVFLVWLTVLLGPCSLVRYVVVLWFIVPLLLSVLFSGERFGGENA